MESFFIKVAVGALLQLIKNDEFNAWVDKKRAALVENVEQHINDLEATLLDKVEGLPAEIVGDAESTVKGLLGGVPGDVKGELSPLLDPVNLAKAIVGQMMGQGGQKPPWWPF